MGLLVNVDDAYDPVIIRVAGRLETGNVTVLTSSLTHLFRVARWRVILDCNRLDYLHAAVLPSLLCYEQEAQSHGGDIKWVGLNDELAGVIRLLDRDHQITIFDDIFKAMKAFQAAADARAVA
jgi:anti-anti-sigma factor